MTSTDPLDPMALLGEPLPLPTPWESLARHARWLAEHAERLAAIPPEKLAPYSADTEDPDDVPVLVDELATLNERAANLQSLAAACRRHTWQQLAADGRTHAEIAEMWGIKRAAVGNALNRGRR